MKKDSLPKSLPVFPLSNFIIFPNTTVPLNIFEPRYIDMVNDSMKSNKLVGMIQPKLLKNKDNEIPQLHEIGCMGKITSFKETEETRYLIELKGIIRFKVINEIDTNKRYRECKIDFENYYEDLENKKENIKFSDLELIFKDLKSLFERRGFIINWKALEKQSLNETINALAMASPFSIEEKQVLLEAKNLDIRKTKIAEILTTYSFDQYNNTTIQ
jgi:Lon protease-like protein